MKNRQGMPATEIRIVNEFEIAKIFAFARAGVRSVRFRLATDKVDALLAAAERFAEKHDLRLTVDIIEFDKTRTLAFGLGGAAAGAAIGFGIGGPQGATFGALAGGIGGAVAVNLKISIHTTGPAGDAIIALA